MSGSVQVTALADLRVPSVNGSARKCPFLHQIVGGVQPERSGGGGARGNGAACNPGWGRLKRG